MAEPLVVVEIGNTTIRLAWAGSAAEGADGRWANRVQWPTASFDATDWLRQLPDRPCRWRVSSVHRPAEGRLAREVRTQRPGDDYLCLRREHIPIETDVEFPDRVGVDRLVAAVAARRIVGLNRACGVVDLGTAITVDAISSKGVFLGGAILPGLHLAAWALAEGTDQLPLVDLEQMKVPTSAVGQRTETAIASGVYWGAVGAVKELVRRQLDHLGRDAALLFTGGAAERVAPDVSPAARCVPDLVVRGVACSVLKDE